MRISKQARERTHRTILETARSQFDQIGYQATTTRGIARAAGIAAGTLFNYFPSKEDLGLALIVEAAELAEVERNSIERTGEALAERLFSHIAIELRHFAPARAWISEVLDTTLNPLRTEVPGSLAGELRRRHLERVSGWLREEQGLRPDVAESPVELHLYWSLYLGVLGFWAHDESHSQEASLALLDRSIRLFCHALREE